MERQCVCLVFLLIVGLVRSANILITFEAPRRSHQIWISSLAEPLLDQGHNVTFLSPFSDTLDRIKAKVIEPIPEVKRGKTNFHSISLEGVYGIYSTFNRTQLSHLGPEESNQVLLDDYYKLCDRIFRSKGFKQIWGYPSDFKFDLILTDLSLGNCMFPLIGKFKTAKVIGYSPSALRSEWVEKFANTGKEKGNHATTETSYFQTAKSLIQTKIKNVFIHKDLSIEELAATVLNENFDFENLEKSIAIFLANYNPILNAYGVLGSNIVPVGGLHLKEAEEMLDILAMVLNNANNGFIFFSMGTDIQPHALGKENTETMARAFGKLVQTTVVWRNYSVGQNLPENIFVHAWMPQNDILGHPHMKLLITTGGLLSIQEAIYHGVPVIGIPIYGDQHENVKIITDNQLGMKLDFLDLTEDKVCQAISSVLKNSKYKENMQQFSNKFRRGLGNPLKKALIWINYTLSHDGVEFRRKLLEPSKTNWDVYILMFTIVLSLILSILHIVYRVCNTIFKRFHTREVEKEKTQ